MGTCVKANTQLINSERAMTTNNGLTISATADGARYSGRNEKTAISVAPSRPPFGPSAPRTRASRKGVPEEAAVRALSVTTMALSTNIPIAIINPASEVRFIPSPVIYMQSIVPPMVKSSDEPISEPLRAPIASIMTTMTMATDSRRLTRNDMLARRAISSSG